MAWKVGAVRNLDIVHSSSWDGQKAKDQIFELAGWPDDPKPATARKGFLFYNDDDTSLKGNYKSPFCYVQDEKLVAVDAGLAASRQRINQITDVPDDIIEKGQAVLDAYKKRQEKEASKSFRVTLPIMRVEPPDWGEPDGLYIRVEASGKERDSHKSRMSQKCLERFVEYAEQGIDGEPLPFLDGHYEDLLAAVLGEIYAPYITEDDHFAFYAKLDERNPQALRLYDDLGKGKRHGASIAGWAHEYEEEVYTDDEGGEQEGIIYHDIELMEVSRTSWPSWQPAFCELVTNKLSTDKLDFSRSRKAIEVRKSVSLCRPDGMCLQLVRDDGRASLLTLYASTLALTRNFSPELVKHDPNTLLEGHLESGLIKLNDVQTCARESETFFASLPLAERVKFGNEVGGVYRKHLQCEPPMPLVLALGRAVDKLEIRNLLKLEVTNMEGNEGVQAPEVENQAAGVVEAPENGQVSKSEPVNVPVAKGVLADTVDARMLGSQFSEATWAMQDLVWNALYDTDMPKEDRVTQAETVIGEFSEMAVGLVRKMAESGYIPRSVDEFRRLAAERVELSEGRLSIARIGMIKESLAALVGEGVDLMELLECSDVELDDMIANEESVIEEETPEPIANSQPAPENQLMQYLNNMAQERAAKVDSIFENLRSHSGAPVAPAGTTSPTPVPSDQKQSLEQAKSAWTQSLDGRGPRRVGRKRRVPQQQQ